MTAEAENTRERPPPLAAGLLRGADWFNEALLAELATAGWPKLSRTQSQIFPLLGTRGVSQSELARRLGITRQSVNSLVRELIELDILTTETDEGDARVSLVTLTERGEQLASDARSVLGRLEDHLATLIGGDAVELLRSALFTDWGPAPSLAPDARSQPNP